MRSVWTLRRSRGLQHPPRTLDVGHDQEFRLVEVEAPGMKSTSVIISKAAADYYSACPDWPGKPRPDPSAFENP